MSVKNLTGGDLVVICPHNETILDGNSSALPLVEEVACDGHPPTCTYTRADGTTGSLQIIVNNACDAASPKVMPEISAPHAFGCSPIVPAPSGQSEHQYCEGFQHLGDSYIVTAYFAVTKDKVEYDLKWNDVKMNLEKGQLVGNKLASSLIKNISTDNTKFNQYTAKYDGQTLFINLIAQPTSPYRNAQTPSDCERANS